MVESTGVSIILVESTMVESMAQTFPTAAPACNF